MNIAVFASGGGSNFQAILNKIKSGELKNAAIVLLISNNSSCGAMEIAKSNNIKTIHISNKTHPDPVEYENALSSSLEKSNVELIALAGYMKLLPVRIVRKYPNKILNIHPALLPKFGGKGMFGIHVHEAVLRAGEKESGVTIHFVNENYDEGRIIRQSRVPLLPEDTPETLAARVLKAEHDLYWRVIDEMVNGPCANKKTFNNTV